MSWWPWEHEDEIEGSPKESPVIDAKAAAEDAERLGWLPWTHGRDAGEPDGGAASENGDVAPDTFASAAEDADWDDGPEGSWAAFPVVPGEDDLLAEPVALTGEDGFAFHDDAADAAGAMADAAGELLEPVAESTTNEGVDEEPVEIASADGGTDAVDEGAERDAEAPDAAEAPVDDLIAETDPVEAPVARPWLRAMRWPWSRPNKDRREAVSEDTPEDDHVVPDAEPADDGHVEAPATGFSQDLELTLAAPAADEAQLSLLDDVAEDDRAVGVEPETGAVVMAPQPAESAGDTPVASANGTNADADTQAAQPGTDDVPEAAAHRGYRTLLRTRKRGRIARMAAAKQDTSRIARVAMVAGRVLRVVALIVVGAVVVAGLLFGLILGVNAFARWNARRIAAQTGVVTTAAQNNVLVIGVTDGQAVGFAALKAERSDHRVLGIAIPDGAFVEVPGQGFERLGDSYVQGPDVSKDAVSNYLMVRFGSYVVVSGQAYQQLMNSQNVGGIMGQVQATDLSRSERDALSQYLATVGTKNVWIVPLPVKPIAVGDQQYFEPEKAQVADLLLQWWGVKVDEQKSMPRVIVYNGVGTPGIAGKAAQQLIRKGFEVVDSGNADNFKHKTTLILLYHGTAAEAQGVHDALGTGQVLVQSAPQDIADMIVIVGADYQPPANVTDVTPTPAP